MKKLKSTMKEVFASEVLTREQMRKTLGGAGGCPTNMVLCSCNGDKFCAVSAAACGALCVPFE